MELDDLPNEVLMKVASYLSAQSLVIFGATCRRLQHISNIESLWLDLCKKDFQVQDRSGWNVNFKLIYTKILHRYPILGFHKLALQPLGGLMHASWTEGEILVQRIFPGETSLDDLIPEPAFSLTWSDDRNELDVRCLANGKTRKPAHIMVQTIGKERFITLSCADIECHKKHKRKETLLGQNDYQNGFPKEFDDEDMLNFSKTVRKKGYNCPLVPIKFCPVPDQFPVTPGFYRSSYSTHGIEILQVRASEHTPNVMECLKITGDPNVPAGKFSLVVDLSKPIILSEEEQNAMPSQIREVDKNRTKEDYEAVLNLDHDTDWVQPFLIPTANYHHEEVNIPQNCTSRFIARGKIAFTHFTNPHFSPAHAVVFNKDLFGIVWHELFFFGLLHHVTEPLGLL